MLFYFWGLKLSDWSFLKNTISPEDFTIDCRSQGSFEEGTIKGAYYFPFIKKAYGSDPESDKKVLTHVKGVLDKIEADLNIVSALETYALLLLAA